MKNLNKLVFMFATFMIAGTFTSAGYSQDESGSSLQIEEIIVTAQKREQSAQDVPISITALDEELLGSTIRNLSDITGYAPNVVFGENGRRPGGSSIQIRGIAAATSNDNTFDSPIAINVDGIYLGQAAGSLLDNFDMERIEILRGPQGTLFGKNTTGGVINVIRTRPTGEFGGKVQATIGEDGRQELRAVINTSLADNLAAKFFGTSIQSDGWMPNITLGGHNGEEDYQAYGVTFLFTPNDRFEALLTIERMDDQSALAAYNQNFNVAPGVIPPPPPGPNTTDFSGGLVACAVYAEACRTSPDPLPYAENDTQHDASVETDAITLQMTYELNENLTVKYIGGYRDVSEDRIYDFDGSAAPFITIERWNVYDQTSHELQLNGSYNNVEFTAGLYMFEKEHTQDWATGGDFWGFLYGGLLTGPGMWEICQDFFDPTLAIACDATEPAYPTGTLYQILYSTQKTESIAAYAQADWSVTDRLTLTTGVRWTEEEKDFYAGQAYLAGHNIGEGRNFPDYADLQKKWDDTSIKLGLSYQINEDSLAYLTYTEGFHSGGFYAVVQQTKHMRRNQYDPEFSESTELGIKAFLFDRRVQLNAAYFINDYAGKQEESTQIDNETKTVASFWSNVAEAEYEGFEIDVQILVNEYLRVFANYGTLDASYQGFVTDINEGDGITKLEPADFLIPRFAPEESWGVGGTLSVPAGNGTVDVFAKFSVIGEQETDLLNADLARAPETDNLTASIGYFQDNWSIVVYGTNLTDEQYEVVDPIMPLFAIGTINEGRKFGVELTYDF